ncbi:alpha/beta hydrolase [Nocardia sp. NPDC004568]|uniref:alpha/beta fold hydrolase n=1 Tax=Nocardia sp. NPDC004568 TaxID=3154551 RepID=UPI0033AD7F9A
MFTYPGQDGHPLRAEARGAGATVVLMHSGGPDHRSLLPLADRLADTYRVVLPDIRGYGQSPCPDPAAHTWCGATAHPQRFDAAILISLEDIEDDAAKQAETALLDAFAETVTTHGVEAAWAPILPGLAPVIGTLVREAIPRSDPASIAAAAAIGRDRAFRTPADLTALTVPTLVIPGIDHRHPTRFAEEVAGLLPNGRLVRDAFPARVDTADDLAAALAPSIRKFLGDTLGR